MTEDFKLDFITALEKEGYKYIFILHKDIDMGVNVASNIDEEYFSQEHTFISGRTVSNFESLVEAMRSVLDPNKEQHE